MVKMRIVDRILKLRENDIIVLVYSLCVLSTVDNLTVFWWFTGQG